VRWFPNVVDAYTPSPQRKQRVDAVIIYCVLYEFFFIPFVSRKQPLWLLLSTVSEIRRRAHILYTIAYYTPSLPIVYPIYFYFIYFWRSKLAANGIIVIYNNNIILCAAKIQYTNIIILVNCYYFTSFPPVRYSLWHYYYY
jgi:hypothetical protein